MSLVFRALVSVYEGIDARGNTVTRHLGDSPDAGHSSPIYWVKGDKAADDYADFYDGSWDSRNYKNSKGADIHPSGGRIWTGSRHDGHTRLHGRRHQMEPGAWQPGCVVEPLPANVGSGWGGTKMEPRHGQRNLI